MKNTTPAEREFRVKLTKRSAYALRDFCRLYSATEEDFLAMAAAHVLHACDEKPAKLEKFGKRAAEFRQQREQTEEQQAKARAKERAESATAETIVSTPATPQPEKPKYKYPTGEPAACRFIPEDEDAIDGEPKYELNVTEYDTDGLGEPLFKCEVDPWRWARFVHAVENPGPVIAAAVTEVIERALAPTTPATP